MKSWIAREWKVFVKNVSRLKNISITNHQNRTKMPLLEWAMMTNHWKNILIFLKLFLKRYEETTNFFFFLSEYKGRCKSSNANWSQQIIKIRQKKITNLHLITLIVIKLGFQFLRRPSQSFWLDEEMRSGYTIFNLSMAILYTIYKCIYNFEIIAALASFLLPKLIIYNNHFMSVFFIKFFYLSEIFFSNTWVCLFSLASSECFLKEYLNLN